MTPHSNHLQPLDRGQLRSLLRGSELHRLNSAVPTNQSACQCRQQVSKLEWTNCSRINSVRDRVYKGGSGAPCKGLAEGDQTKSFEGLLPDVGRRRGPERELRTPQQRPYKNSVLGQTWSTRQCRRSFRSLNCSPPSACSGSTRAWQAPPSERHTLSVSRASGLRVVIQLPTEACHRLWCAREHIESSVPGPPANRTNSEKPESSHDGSLSLGQRSSSHERPPNGKTPQSNIGQQSALLLRLGAQRLFSRARLHKLPRTNIQPAKVAPRRAVERKP